jgi:hypothetical protein
MRPLRRRREPVPAAAAVERFRRRGRGGPGAAVGAAAQAWPTVVGRAAADHSVPVRRSRAGVVTVACASASWAQELAGRRFELAARLAERCPDAEVSALRFVVADHALPGPPAEAAAPPPPAAPGPAERRVGAAAAEGVGEPVLRELVARAAAAAAARRKPS